MSELIMTINVTTYDAQMLEGQYSRVVMIPFSAEATGKYFNGKTVANGIDTQITTKGGFSLSARYMLEGIDSSGKKCRLFIENNGTSLENCKPKIYIQTARNWLFWKTQSLRQKLNALKTELLSVYFCDAVLLHFSKYRRIVARLLIAILLWQQFGNISVAKANIAYNLSKTNGFIIPFQLRENPQDDEWE